MAERNELQMLDSQMLDDGDVTELPSHAPPSPPLERVAKEVVRDGQRDADEYLEETRVPFGGE